MFLIFLTQLVSIPSNIDRINLILTVAFHVKCYLNILHGNYNFTFGNIFDNANWFLLVLFLFLAVL